MKPIQRYAELFTLALIVYSLVTYIIELEFAGESPFFVWSERIVTVLFTAEYGIRWFASRSLSYPLRPMAIVDLVAILPFYLGFLIDLRALRLVRVLRIARLFKLYRYTSALQSISNAFFRVRYEFAVVGFAVVTLGLISSVAVYELERDAQPEVFARFSDAVWYTLSTLTTVGYGDKVPITPGGRLVASFLMIGGLALFGTFVSLIGSAFLEEIRQGAAKPDDDPTALVISPPFGPPHFSAEAFDPAQTLRAIDAGELGSDDPRHAAMLRLLAAACRQLLT
jgi:voltage-gated potassium channel